MSHVHVLSCIHTFNSLCSSILCSWSFFDCLSLSLSLSLFLELVYSMTPKRKSTPSQNLLHSGASTSSFDPTLSHVQFHDDKGRKDFLKNFSWGGINLECQVILLEFFDTDLPIVIYSKGWESLLGMAILPRPAWPAPPRVAPCGFSPPCKGDGAGMGRDFRPAPRGGTGMGLHFLGPSRPVVLSC